MTTTTDMVKAKQDDSSAKLAELEAYGNAFLACFGWDQTATPSDDDSTNKKGKPNAKFPLQQQERDDIQRGFHGSEHQDEDERDDFGWHSRVSDAQEVVTKPSVSSIPKPRSRSVETVVFQAESSGSRAPDAAAKKGWKAFMSSKIEKIGKEDELIAAEQAALTQEEENEEKQLESNDRALSQLLSTTLFAPGSNSGNKKLSSTDTLAKVLELSSSETQRKGVAIGRGWGENELKRRELSKMPASHRAGIRRAAGEKRDKDRETAKQLGTWHQSIKHEYTSQATALERGSKKNDRKRQRGLGVGIGKFQGGQLKLSKDDVATINHGSSSDGPSKGGPKRRKKH